MQLLDCRSRLQPQLAGECLPQPAKGRQRVGGAAGAVQRRHQLSAHALAAGLGVHPRLEGAYRILVASQRQQRLGHLLHGVQSQTLQPGSGGRHERPRRVGQCRSAPHLQTSVVRRKRAASITSGVRLGRSGCSGR